MPDYYEKILQASSYIKDHLSEPPKVAIVLGTGLGNFSSSIQNIVKLPYHQLPHFPEATVKGHEGCLILGKIGKVPVIAQSGRFHFYEGYNMKQVTFPIRVFGTLGVDIVIIASAVGGIHQDYEAGDVSIVNDHINLHHENPLNGPNDERLGPRFPDMSEAYDRKLINTCHRIAEEKGITLHNSIYAGLPGPNLETPAEYRFLHTIGATVVGMSTVPEVIVARHMNIPVCVLTAITNKCYPIEEIGKTTHDDVIRVAQKAEKNITAISRALISNYV